MSMTPAERNRKYRTARKLKSINVSEDALDMLRAYQKRWELPNLSIAVEHAVIFSNPK